jgi:hypothetical protein
MFQMFTHVPSLHALWILVMIAAAVLVGMFVVCACRTAAAYDRSLDSVEVSAAPNVEQITSIQP